MWLQPASPLHYIKIKMQWPPCFRESGRAYHLILQQATTTQAYALPMEELDLCTWYSNLHFIQTIIRFGQKNWELCWIKGKENLQYKKSKINLQKIPSEDIFDCSTLRLISYAWKILLIHINLYFTEACLARKFLFRIHILLYSYTFFCIYRCIFAYMQVDIELKISSAKSIWIMIYELRPIYSMCICTILEFKPSITEIKFKQDRS